MMDLNQRLIESTSLEHLEARLRADGPGPLLEALSAILDQMPADLSVESEGVVRTPRTLRLILTAIRRESFFLARHRDSLLQTIWLWGHHTELLPLLEVWRAPYTRPWARAVDGYSHLESPKITYIPGFVSPSRIQLVNRRLGTFLSSGAEGRRPRRAHSPPRQGRPRPTRR